MSDLSDHDVIQGEVSLQELLAPLIPTDTHIARINDMCWMLKSMAESLEQDHRRASDQLRVAACSLRVQSNILKIPDGISCCKSALAFKILSADTEDSLLLTSTDIAAVDMTAHLFVKLPTGSRQSLSCSLPPAVWHRERDLKPQRPKKSCCSLMRISNERQVR